MTTKTIDVDDNAKNIINPGYKHLIAGRLDAIDENNRIMAKKMHDLKYIYALYGAMDGLSLSYSMLKLCFDLYLANTKISSSDTMHDWTMTPEGIAVAATESISLIVFAVLANYFDDDDRNFIKRYIAILWPYFRDSLKALKNTYKGVRSVLDMMNQLGAGTSLNFMLIPASLALGLVLVVNRLLMRYMVEDRKAKMKANDNLLKEVMEAFDLSETKYQELRNQIRSQNPYVRAAARLGAGIGGTLDSWYLYMGVLSLTSVIFPLFVAMSVCCMVYSVLCVAIRVFEEYDFQRKLLITQARIDLVLYSQQYYTKMVGMLVRLQEIALQLKQLSNSEEDTLLRIKLEAKKNSILQKVHQFETGVALRREALTSLSFYSPLAAAFLGARAGLAAYGASISVLFAITTIFSLAAVPFPPLVLVVVVFLGMFSLFGFIAYSVITNHQKNKAKAAEPDEHLESLSDVLKLIKDVNHQDQELNVEEKTKTIIEHGMALKSTTPSRLQQWFEVGSEDTRSGCSGLGKGFKAVDYTMNPLQDVGQDGHYHDTAPMLGVMAVSSIVFAIVLALRAHVRGFGRVPPGTLPTIDSAAGKVEEPVTQDAPMVEMQNMSADKPALVSRKESGLSDEQKPGSREKIIIGSSLIHRFFKPRSTPPSFSATSQTTFSTFQ